MTRPVLLDLFCGAGGAAVGYHRAGFNVVGVDHHPQPRYPFPFIQADALTPPVRLTAFAAIHASPPCQDHSVLNSPVHGTGWMLAATMTLVRSSGRPWVVENVPGAEADMGGAHVTLCGSAFDLAVRRHRHFACSFLVLAPLCRHAEQGQPLGVYGNGGGYHRDRGWKATLPEARAGMEIEWMNRAEISQAIPPAYTEHIGAQLMEAI